MRARHNIDFAEFDALDDRRDIEARESAIALDRMAREATQQRDAIIRRLRLSIALPTNTMLPLDHSPFDVSAITGPKKA